MLREAGVESLNLDLMFGVPGQSRPTFEADLDDLLALEPDHISYYELEAKPGTRFTHRHGGELERQADAMEDYYELVVGTLRSAGYRWYETPTSAGRVTSAGTTSATGSGTTTWASASAPSPRSGSSGAGTGPACRGTSRRSSRRRPPAELELLTPAERGIERLMLGLRLDRPLELDGLAASSTTMHANASLPPGWCAARATVWC